MESKTVKINDAIFNKAEGLAEKGKTPMYMQ